MTGHIPEMTLTRRTKGDYTRSMYEGIRRNASTLDDLFTRSRLAELGLIHEHIVRDMIRRARDGMAIPLGALDQLVGTELWLRHDRRSHLRADPGKDVT
jgi:asparagine synthase (glutamine-hydrolysing)